MTKHTHTPGPWVSDRPWSGFGAIRDGRDRIVFALAHGSSSESYVPSDDCEANARLISAAPEMLAALEDMLAGWRYIRESHGDLYGVGWDRAEGKARSAIAKARGT